MYTGPISDYDVMVLIYGRGWYTGSLWIVLTLVVHCHILSLRKYWVSWFPVRFGHMTSIVSLCLAGMEGSQWKWLRFLGDMSKTLAKIRWVYKKQIWGFNPPKIPQQKGYMMIYELNFTTGTNGWWWRHQTLVTYDLVPFLKSCSMSHKSCRDMQILYVHFDHWLALSRILQETVVFPSTTEVSHSPRFA